MRALLVRTSAMGDIVHSLPVLGALRRAHPGVQVGWVVEETFAPLLEDHADIDTLIPVRTRAWRRPGRRLQTVREIRQTIRALRAFRADVAFDLMGNHKGGLLARLSGARRVIGAARRDRREPSSALWVKERVTTPGHHAVDRALAHLVPLGIERPTVDLGGAALLPSAVPDPAEEAVYAVIQAGAGWGNKQYPPAWWGRVAQALYREAGIATRVPTAPGEEHLVDTVVRASKGSAHEVDARAFRDLVALLRGARLVLGGDTGPLHLAHALGTPTLCLMGPTDPRRHGPYGAPERTLFERLPCSFCYKRMNGTRACLLTIPPERVAQRACAVLG